MEILFERKKREALKSRIMKYHIITYGCQTNKSDSEKIETILKKSGHSPSRDEKSSDLIVINACSVRQSAIDRVLGKIKNISGGRRKIVVSGCILKEDAETILQYSGVSILTKGDIEIEPTRENRFSALIPIISGCDNFCSYCVVPYTRGRERSRSPEKILKEANQLAKDGFKEIWLLGQNVNSYKGNLEISDFASLLGKIKDIPENFWIRFTSSHPKDFKNKLIKTMKESEKITEYVNLPVQSGDNDILKKMNRPYSVFDYKKCVENLRKEIPEISLSTDVIVGFPGETEKNFENTVKLFEEIGFDMAYISKYSPRPGTASFKLKDDVSLKEKSKREKILNGIVERTALKRNEGLIGKTVDVLFHGIRKDYLLGKTRGYKTVKVRNSGNLVGTFAKVKITKALSWGLQGRISQK